MEICRMTRKKCFSMAFITIVFGLLVCIKIASAEESKEFEIRLNYKPYNSTLEIVNNTSNTFVSRAFDRGVSPLIFVFHESNGLIKDRFWERPVSPSQLQFSGNSQKQIRIRPGKKVLQIAIEDFCRFQFQYDGFYFIFAVMKKGYSINDGLIRSNLIKLKVKGKNIIFYRVVENDAVPETFRIEIEKKLRQLLEDES